MERRKATTEGTWRGTLRTLWCTDLEVKQIKFQNLFVIILQAPTPTQRNQKAVSFFSAIIITLILVCIRVSSISISIKINYSTALRVCDRTSFKTRCVRSRKSSSEREFSVITVRYVGAYIHFPTCRLSELIGQCLCNPASKERYRVISGRCCWMEGDIRSTQNFLRQ